MRVLLLLLAVLLPASALAQGATQAAADLARAIDLRLQAKALVDDPEGAEVMRRKGQTLLIRLEESLATRDDASAKQLRRRALFHLAALNCDAGDLDRARSELRRFEALSPSIAERTQANEMWIDCTNEHRALAAARTRRAVAGPVIFGMGASLLAAGAVGFTVGQERVTRPGGEAVNHQGRLLAPAFRQESLQLRSVATGVLVGGAVATAAGSALWIGRERALATAPRAWTLVVVPGGVVVAGRF